MKFNEKIILLRKENNLSQEQLAEKLDVARQTVSKWELGETTPDMDKLLKISEIFNITLDELMKDENISDIKNESNNNTENTQKLAGMAIKIIKGIGIFLLISAIIYVLMIVIGVMFFKANNVKNNSEVKIISSKNLTIGRVKELASKGEELSWVDFEEYENRDIGSGLRILYYEIEGPYHLLIGGSSEYEKPMYIKLVVDDDNSKSIDIRTENIDEFIKDTRNLGTEAIDVN